MIQEFEHAHSLFCRNIRSPLQIFEKKGSPYRVFQFLFRRHGDKEPPCNVGRGLHDFVESLIRIEL